MNELELNFDFESIKRDSNNFEKIKVEIDGYKLTKMNDNYYIGRIFEESGFSYYFNNQENNWVATETPQYGGMEKEYKSFDDLRSAIEECENLC